MQRPPAASIPLVRSPRAGRILLVLSLVFAGVPVYGVYAGMPMGSTGVLAILWCITSVWLMHYWVNLPQGRLRWDGESWHWSGATEPLKAVAIQYDFQTSLWVLIQPAGARAFGVWVDADPANLSQWRAMRRALVGAGSMYSGSDNSRDVGVQALR